MALSEACKMILGGGPLGISSRNRGRIGIPSLAASDIAPRQRIALTVSSKVKQNNLSSKAKRQQRKARRSPSPLRDATINGEGGTKVQNSPDDHNASSQPDVSLNSINGSKDNTIMEAEVLENDFSHEGDVVGDEVPGVELLDGIAFRDLTAMIRNAEKNILLLNQARISALEDVEKILVEKEGLQKEVHRLETEIAVMGTVNKFSAKGLKELDKTGLVSEVLSLKEELHTLKRENISLKADLDTLQKKLSDEGGLLKKEGKDSDLSRASLEAECKDLKEKVENLQILLENTKNMNVFDKHEELQKENELLQHKVESLEEQLRVSDEEINAQIEQYQTSVMEFEETLNELKEESKKRSVRGAANDMPWSFWSGLLLTLDGWFLEKKITADDVKVLRNMAWKRDYQIRDAYLSCKDKSDLESISILLKLITPLKSSGLHIVHIAAEMAPVAKVGGLGDVVSGLSKALQKKGHLVEIILPKYDCMNHDIIKDLKELDTPVQSYFDGQLYENKIWVGVVEGLPVYFIEPQHPWKLFSRGQYYGEHDDFKRFSFFSRAALELLYQSGKKPDIIHCHDWQTAFVPPLYWDVYSVKGFNSARICFTCHNFEYQGTSHASELASCGLDVQQLHRPDRMQDNSSHDRINPVKGAIVYSNIVTTVSPTYAQEVRTAEGGRGLQETLNFHSRKFSGILNGIDTDAWNPATDSFLSHQYSSQDLHGKAENKDALRKRFNLSSDNSLQPLVGCITRLVPQKGVHLIRHAIYRTLELGGQFILLGSSPVPHIQREFEEIANHFRDHPHARLILSYDEALSRAIFAASDMFIIPSIFEPCGLTQMISMRYGSVPIVRKTGGLNDSVFDVDDQSVPAQLQNGFTFITPDEKGLSEAMERAFDLYTRNPKEWRDLVEKIMRIDFSWDSSSAQYEELYQSSLARARKSIKENAS